MVFPKSLKFVNSESESIYSLYVTFAYSSLKCVSSSTQTSGFLEREPLQQIPSPEPSSGAKHIGPDLSKFPTPFWFPFRIKHKFWSVWVSFCKSFL